MKMTTLMMAVVMLMMAEKGALPALCCIDQDQLWIDNRTDGELKGNFVKRLKSIVILFRTLLKEWSFSYSIYTCDNKLVLRKEKKQ